ncbi:MAG: energy transducer TonB [Opitutales bacterium]|nr:energy transducer TonB [Opitutales bacterium]
MIRTLTKITTASLICLYLGACSKNDDKATDTADAKQVEAAVEQVDSNTSQAKATTANSNGDSPPALQYFPMPDYPVALQKRAIEGEVCVKIRVNADGKAEDVTVSSSTHKEFEQSLLESIPEWVFKPARKNGIAVARTVFVAIPFLISNRNTSLPVMDNSQPELVGVVRPPHPKTGASSAVVQISISPSSTITDISIASHEGSIDARSIIDSVAQWTFFPSRSRKGTGLPAIVLAKITYTESGNVLIQYPFPAPAQEADSAKQNAQ